MDYLYTLQCIRESTPDFVNMIFYLISEVVLKGGVVVAAYIYWCINKSEGMTILLGYTTSYSVNQLIKNTACVYRPWIKDSRLYVAPSAASSATGYSFPSGHTVTAASIFGGIGIWQRNRKWLTFLMFFIVLLTAFSRNWLGAHTMADVLTAIVDTALIMCLIFVIKYFAVRSNKLQTVLCFGGIALSIIILIILEFKNYPMDYTAEGVLLVNPYDMKTDCYTACGMSCGALLGWWLEKRFVNFEIQGVWWRKLIRFLCGFVLVFGFYLTGGKIFSFMGPHFSHLAKYFIMIFLATFIYPLFIKLVQKKLAVKAEASTVEKAGK